HMLGSFKKDKEVKTRGALTPSQQNKLGTKATFHPVRDQANQKELIGVCVGFTSEKFFPIIECKIHGITTREVARKVVKWHTSQTKTNHKKR
ncbi:hypothetical protein AACB49_19490, partial [Enterococcus faecium]